MPFRAHGPEPCASAYSATRAYSLNLSEILDYPHLARSPYGERSGAGVRKHQVARTSHGETKRRCAYHYLVPAYEFRCRQCGSTFVESRPMSESSDPALCPQGHSDTTRLMSVAAVATSKDSSPARPAGGGMTSGGGCCGGGCGCG